jgi:hypothetical protein
MDQAANIHRVAEDMVWQHGKDAYVYLREKAQVATLFGDQESAIAWWDIALAVLEILKEQKGRLALASAHLAFGFEALTSSI